MVISRTFKAKTAVSATVVVFQRSFHPFLGEFWTQSVYRRTKITKTGGSSATGPADANPRREARTHKPPASVHSLSSSFVSFRPLHQLRMSTCEQVPRREAVCSHSSSASPVELLGGNGHVTKRSPRARKSARWTEAGDVTLHHVIKAFIIIFTI